MNAELNPDMKKSHRNLHSINFLNCILLNRKKTYSYQFSYNHLTKNFVTVQIRFFSFYLYYIQLLYLPNSDSRYHCRYIFFPIKSNHFHLLYFYVLLGLPKSCCNFEKSISSSHKKLPTDSTWSIKLSGTVSL